MLVSLSVSVCVCLSRRLSLPPPLSVYIYTAQGTLQQNAVCACVCVCVCACVRVCVRACVRVPLVQFCYSFCAALFLLQSGQRRRGGGGGGGGLAKLADRASDCKARSEFESPNNSIKFRTAFQVVLQSFSARFQNLTHIQSSASL